MAAMDGERRSLVVDFNADARGERTRLIVLPMPDLNDVVVDEISGWRVAGEVFTYAGHEVELRRE